MCLQDQIGLCASAVESLVQCSRDVRDEGGVKKEDTRINLLKKIVYDMFGGKE